MNVITTNPIIYSNATGYTKEDDALLKAIKSKCGDRPGAFHPKKRKAFDSCRDGVINATKKPVTAIKSKAQKMNAVLKKTDKTTKSKEDVKKTPATPEATTDAIQDATQDTSKNKKLLLIGGGVLVVVILAVVLMKRRK